jgi:hypothetical protein
MAGFPSRYLIKNRMKEEGVGVVGLGKGGGGGFFAIPSIGEKSRATAVKSEM